jgi:hypothetical protein
MLRKLEAVAVSVFACAALVAAAPRQSLKIVPDTSAVGVRAQGGVVSVGWVQLSGAGSQVQAEPLAGDIYYAASPAAGDLSKYTKVVSTVADNELAPFGGTAAMKRVTRFVPARQGGRMGAGVYYIIVASVSGGDTLYSDYLTLMVASSDPPSVLSPKAEILKGESVKKVSDLAPLFSWKPVVGVPYYHVVLSDKPFVDAGGKICSGVNIVWQAITPNTRIAYGAPDPSNSNTVTATPPPLSPGTTYSWMVLNNYGNSPAFTSWDVRNDMDVFAGRFEIEGSTLAVPRAVSPADGGVFDNERRIEFKWTNLDPGANSYRLNLFMEGGADEFGMGGMGEFSMSLLVWETTVPRGNRGRGDTLSVALDAASTLTGGSYRWRVYALDSRGAATTGDASVSEFEYRKTDEGRIRIETFDRVGGVELPVGYVELKSEAMSGPAMAPLLFYTDGKGELGNRVFPAGTYRITAVKDGYFTHTSTVSVRSGARTDVSISLQRTEAVLYGRALAAADSSGVNAARVTAVSEWGDTAYATTDGGGNFKLSCRAADWTVTAEKPGLRAAASRKVTLRVGDNYDFGGVYLTRNPFALSGVVRNAAGGPLVGALVRVLRDGVIIDELASTPQSGGYAFYLSAGTYTVTAEKPGFAMFSRSVVVTGTMTQDVTLREGAVLVGGSVIGRSWVNAAGVYVTAPIASARLVFAEAGAGTRDTFTVTGDPVFGKFSVSLPIDRDYSVTASAAGFAPSAAARPFTTRGVGGDLSASYDSDTLYALAAVRGNIAGLPDGVRADVIVFDGEGRAVASVKSGVGAYEVRNIPNGTVTVEAGAEGYFAAARYAISVSDGRPTVAEPAGVGGDSCNFTMSVGANTVRFTVADYKWGGAVKVVSPFNRTLDLDNGAAALAGVGNGNYTVEAVPDAGHKSLLMLSSHKFSVSAAEHAEELRFPFTHAPKDTIRLIDRSYYKMEKPTAIGGQPPSKITFYYRSEGNARFDSMDVGVGTQLEFDVSPARVRDGCNLYYYFRVEMDNGDIYGSSKQLYGVYVKPEDNIISRVAIEPGVSGGDTLALPSSYQAAFAFRALYSDQFVPASVKAGTVNWRVLDAETRVQVVSGTGWSYTYTTPGAERDLILRAEFTPAKGFEMKAGVSGAVEFPVRVTGKRLKSVEVVRRGDAGPISNRDKAGFRVEAFDEDGKPVTVLPKWDVYPFGAGDVDTAGLFTPSANFVGVARIVAFAGGLTLEYAEPGAAAPGQSVYYVFRNAAGGDTADTRKGMRVVFGAGALREGASAKLEVAVPALTNHVHRGTGEFRMADSIAFDLTYSDDARTVSGDVTLAFDIPEALRSAANGGDYEFMVARWFPDSLQWIPIDSGRTRVSGGVVTAVLSPELLPATPLKFLKAAARQSSDAAAYFAASARYALVTRTNNTTLAVSVSPHPFSPYIIPKKEYGPAETHAGTCIKVNVQAPESYVKSIKVHIYNATGKMVWGIEKLNAPTGENRFWWNGRTGGRGNGRAAVNEEAWSEDYYERNAGRPLCRNGRYYVMVIIKDTSDKQRRVMKPLVLMK